MEKCVFDKGRKCTILCEKNCEKCSFRKTAAELDAGREKARERLEGLPEDQYNAIQKKYYGLRRCAEVDE